jgi:Domain of unknown function (DUF6851)
MAARKLPIILAVLLVVSVGLTAARVGGVPAQAATGDSVVLAWNQQVLNAIKETKTGPTIAARALAVVHTAIYDAWAAYDPVAVDSRQRLRVNPDLRQPAAERTLDNKTKAVSFAAYAAWSTCSQARTNSRPSPPRWATCGMRSMGPTPRRRPAWAGLLPRRCWSSATRTAPTS